MRNSHRWSDVTYCRVPISLRAMLKKLFVGSLLPNSVAYGSFWIGNGNIQIAVNVL